MKNLLSKRLIKARNNKNYSKEKICELTSIPLHLYIQYEDGYLEPSMEELTKIANALEVSTDYFKEDITNEEICELKKEKKYKIIKAIISFVIIILVWLFIEVVSNPKPSTRFYINDGKYTYYYEIKSSPIFGKGSVSLIYSNNEDLIEIPEVVSNQSFIIPSYYEVTEVCLSGLKGDVVIPKTVSLITKKEYHEVSNDQGNYMIYFPFCKSIKVKEDNPYFDSRNDCNCIIETKTNKLIAGATQNVFIPEGVTEITSGAFYAQDIYEITIPSSVKVIHSFAFFDSNIRKINFNDGIEELEDCAFIRQYGSHDLTENIILPKTLKKVSRIAFANYWLIDFIYMGDEDIHNILTHANNSGYTVANNNDLRINVEARKYRKGEPREQRWERYYQEIHVQSLDAFYNYS